VCDCACVCVCMHVCAVFHLENCSRRRKIVAQRSNGGDMSCLVFIIQYASKKMMPTFGTLFRNVFTAQLAPQIGRLLLRIEGFLQRSGKLLPKSAGFVHT